ncbi:hypothetical protein I4U23_006552 [Adineta vaga]|nr:hypothetical protein I4U23_006552 [Adineta vaga]
MKSAKLANLLLNRYLSLSICRFDKSKITTKELLADYEKKRDFNKTTEPKPTYNENQLNKHRFVVQEHHASNLHFDLRLESNGVMKRCVPKGPSLSPYKRRLAIMVEDHPISYMNFEGKIPDGEYGAGEVRIWDSGTYEPLENDGGDIDGSIEKGELTFRLYGKKLKGKFRMIRSRFGPNQPKKQWLLLKTKDEFANQLFVLERILDYGSRRDLQTMKEKKPASTNKIKIT